MIQIHTIPSAHIYTQAANRLIERIKTYGYSKQKVLILLSGGSVVRLYPILTDDIKHAPDRWKMITFAQVDERFQPEATSEINAKAISTSGLTEVLGKNKIPFFQIPQRGTLKISATSYHQTLSKLFSACEKKLAVLGVGTDCHTAGLLPGYQKEWDVDQLVVGYKNAGKFKQRITMTPKAFAEIDYALVVAMGDEKRQALKNILNSTNNTQLDKYPAKIIQKITQVDLFTDLLME